MDVATFLRGLGLEQYEQAFRDNALDGEVLPDLTDAATRRHRRVMRSPLRGRSLDLLAPRLEGHPVGCAPTETGQLPAASEAAVTVWSYVAGHSTLNGFALAYSLYCNSAYWNWTPCEASAPSSKAVHISGLGTSPKSDSPYSRARVIGEQLVAEAFPAATILRPGVIFGREGGFLNRLAALARMSPLFPLFGAGETKLQPVYVGDVAEAVAKALATPATMGRLYELRVYTYKELVQLVLAQIERKRLLMPIPYFAWKVVAVLMAPLPSRLISRNQIELMRQDNVVRADALTLADLGIAPTPVEAMWPTAVQCLCRSS